MTPLVILILSIIVVILSIAGLWHFYRSRDPKMIWVTYYVQDGETITSLAQQYNIPWKKLARENKLTAPYILTPGQAIAVPQWSGAQRVFAPEEPLAPQVEEPLQEAPVESQEPVQAEELQEPELMAPVQPASKKTRRMDAMVQMPQQPSVVETAENYVEEEKQHEQQAIQKAAAVVDLSQKATPPQQPMPAAQPVPDSSPVPTEAPSQPQQRPQQPQHVSAPASEQMVPQPQSAPQEQQTMQPEQSTQPAKAAELTLASSKKKVDISWMVQDDDEVNASTENASQQPAPATPQTPTEAVPVPQEAVLTPETQQGTSADPAVPAGLPPTHPTELAPPQQDHSDKKKIIIGILALVLIVVIIFFVLRMLQSDAPEEQAEAALPDPQGEVITVETPSEPEPTPEPTPEPETTAVIAPEELSVIVLNGGSVPGTATRLEAALKELSYKTETSTNARTQRTGNIIYYGTDAQEASAEALAAVLVENSLDKPTVERDAALTGRVGTDLVVILGK